MSIEAVHSAQAAADAAWQRLAVALGQDHLSSKASPAEVERAHAAVLAAEAEAARADAAVRAAESVTAPVALVV